MTSLNKDSTFDREDLSEMMVTKNSQAGKTNQSRPQTSSTTLGGNDRANAKKMQRGKADESVQKSLKNIEPPFKIQNAILVKKEDKKSPLIDEE